MFLIISLIPSELLSGQKILDHKIFLEELKNGSDNIYKDCLKKYAMHLNKFPNDISVRIEECKFIQYVQYDEDEDFNPNQNDFDSCSSLLIKMFPNNPDVIIFQTTFTWGDDLKEILKNAERTVEENPVVWSKMNLGVLYLKIANQYYEDSDYQSAYTYIQKAIANENKYKSSLEFARILVELKKNQEALDALTSGQDSTVETWQLRQKADLLLKLKAFTNAFEVYNQIDKIDSTFNNNYELACTLEGVGQYDFARKYLIADTSKNWDKQASIRNLLIHDLKYQNGAKSIDSYNKYRDFGYQMDPLAFYRIKLFISHPLEGWKFRDILGILTLIVLLAMLIVAPSIWILPVYFIGHNWNLINQKKSFETFWGLKMFWFVSSGFLIASFLSIVVDPEQIYSLVNSSFSSVELTREKEGIMSLIFIIVFSLFGLATLYKVNPKILLSKNWSIGKSILLGIGIVLAFKIISGIYIRIGITSFGISKTDLTFIPNLLLSSKQNIEAIISTYGKGVGFFLFCILVPVYEEIVFRGVVLDSCHRYINFNTANILQSFLFSTAHLNLFLFPVFFLFGFVTGLMRRNSGGLLSGIVFHVVNNSLAIILIMVRQ
jgi:membrane protease YdiL (CAAX protease family)/tetratricopeptide (TPR) repeat protein